MRFRPSTFARALPATLLLLAVVAAPAIARRLDVEVWTDRGDDAVYEPGDAMRVKVRATDDAYILVYEIDSDGNVSLLYPWKRGFTMVEGRQTLRIPSESSGYELAVERQTGQGFIVALASERPFRDLPWFLRPFDPQAASVGYEDGSDDSARDEEGFDEHGRVVGDPYVAMERIRRRVLDRPADTEGFASAYTTYYVHEQVRYPRYLCNDCHRPSRWAWWDGFDPYYAHCSVFDFRVNWGWGWGPQLWTAYVPYYFYVVRPNCPPRYQRYYNDHTRFSSWDGWTRWNSLWGGQLRRYKPATAPVGYVPPPAKGGSWRQGQTPPGFVPPDVRRQTGTPGSGPRGWLQRDRGDGKPVWRDAPRTPPGQGGGSQGDPPRGTPWRESRWQPRGGDGSPQGGQAGDNERQWRPGRDEPRGEPRQDPPRRESPEWRQPRQEPPRQERPRQEQPRQQPEWRQPRQEPPRQEQPRQQPEWRQPRQEQPRQSPPPQKKPDEGKGGKGGGR